MKIIQKPINQKNTKLNQKSIKTKINTNNNQQKQNINIKSVKQSNWF